MHQMTHGNSEKNYDSHGRYNTNSQMKWNLNFILKSILCDYNDANILFEGTIRITEAGANVNAKGTDEWNQGGLLKTITAIDIRFWKSN